MRLRKWRKKESEKDKERERERIENFNEGVNMF